MFTLFLAQYTEYTWQLHGGFMMCEAGVCGVCVGLMQLQHSAL